MIYFFLPITRPFINKMLLSCGKGVTVYDLTENKIKYQSKQDHIIVESCDVHPTKPYLLFVSGVDNVLHCLDFKSKRFSQYRIPFFDRITLIKISPDGNLLAASGVYSKDGKETVLYVYSLNITMLDLMFKGVSRAHRGRINTIVFLDDKRHIVASDVEGKISLIGIDLKPIDFSSVNISEPPKLQAKIYTGWKSGNCNQNILNIQTSIYDNIRIIFACNRNSVVQYYSSGNQTSLKNIEFYTSNEIEHGNIPEVKSVYLEEKVKNFLFVRTNRDIRRVIVRSNEICDVTHTRGSPTSLCVQDNGDFYYSIDNEGIYSSKNNNAPIIKLDSVIHMEILKSEFEEYFRVSGNVSEVNTEILYDEVPAPSGEVNINSNEVQKKGHVLIKASSGEESANLKYNAHKGGASFSKVIKKRSFRTNRVMNGLDHASDDAKSKVMSSKLKDTPELVSEPIKRTLKQSVGEYSSNTESGNRPVKKTERSTKTVVIQEGLSGIEQGDNIGASSVIPNEDTLENVRGILQIPDSASEVYSHIIDERYNNIIKIASKNQMAGKLREREKLRRLSPEVVNMEGNIREFLKEDIQIDEIPKPDGQEMRNISNTPPRIVSSPKMQKSSLKKNIVNERNTDDTNDIDNIVKRRRSPRFHRSFSDDDYDIMSFDEEKKIDTPLDNKQMLTIMKGFVQTRFDSISQQFNSMYFDLLCRMKNIEDRANKIEKFVSSK